MDTEDYSIFRSNGLVVFTMKRDLHDAHPIEKAAESLKVYLSKKGVASGLLIDLRNCHEFNAHHVVMTVNILLQSTLEISALVKASAVVMNMSNSIMILRAAFNALYTPQRPFDVFESETDAKSFLEIKGV